MYYMLKKRNVLRRVYCRLCFDAGKSQDDGFDERRWTKKGDGREWTRRLRGGRRRRDRHEWGLMMGRKKFA